MSLQARLAALATMIPCSYPLAFHYRTLPSLVMYRLQQIAEHENGHKWDPNLDHGNGAYGLYGIRRSSSQVGVDTWIQLPAILSALVQTIDVTMLHMKKPGGSGIEKMTLQHHGAILWSEYKAGMATDPYMDIVASEKAIPLPPEALLLLLL